MAISKSSMDDIGLLAGMMLLSQQDNNLTGEAGWKNLAAGAVGNASATWAGNQARNITGMQISDPIAKAVAGMGVSAANNNFLDVDSDVVNAATVGMLYDAAGDALVSSGVTPQSIMGQIPGQQPMEPAPPSGGGGGGGGGGNGGGSQSGQTEGSSLQRHRGTVF